MFLDSKEHKAAALEANKNNALQELLLSDILRYLDFSCFTPFTPTLIPRSFSDHTSLRFHVKAHTGENPYCCSYCRRSFSYRYSYRQHLRTHTGEKPYQCSQCNKRFRQHSNLADHLRRHPAIRNCFPVIIVTKPLPY